MKRILLLLAILLVLPSLVSATGYYVSSSGSDTNNGCCDPSAGFTDCQSCSGTNGPWKTLSKAASMSSSDTILLKRGDTWREQLTIPASGITVGAYGTGDKPVISGAEVVSEGWTQYSGNVYYASASGPVYQVFRNGEWAHLAHEPDGGYYTDDVPFDTRWQVGETGDDMSYTNAQISGANLISATVQWNRYNYEIDYYSDTDDAIYLVEDARGDFTGAHFSYNYNPNPNRYWLANKRIFLDQENEWYHDSSTDRLYVYQPGGGTPSGTWEVVNRKIGIYAYQKDNLVIRDIEIRNTLRGIYLKECLSFDIDSVDFNDIGTQTYLPGYESQSTSLGVYLEGNPDLNGESGIIHNCDFNNMLRGAISGSNYGDVVVDGNTITNSATVGEDIGFGPHGSSTSAISPNLYRSTGWIIRNNVITNCGYSCMGLEEGAIVENNVITNAMMYLGDGGAIYAGQKSSVTIRNNIIDTTGSNTIPGFNTICGIYLDGANSDNVVTNNTILNVGWCLFNHHGTNNHWNNNTCIDYKVYGLFANSADYTGVYIQSMEVKGNKFSSSESSVKYHIAFYSSSATDPTPHSSWFDSPSDCDGNTYYPDGATYFYEKPYGSSANTYDFQGWQVATGLDAHSKIQDIGYCTPLWDCSSCTAWSECTGGEQTRDCTCTDLNGCSPDYIDPQSRGCSSPAVNSIVAHYPFDGSADDVSGNGNHGTIVEAAWIPDRKENPDSALFFDGSGDYVEIADSPSLNLTDSISILAWINIASLESGTTNRMMISGKHSSYQFGVGGSGGVNDELIFTIPFVHETHSSSANMEQGIWTHMALTYNSSHVSFFKNGSLVGSAAHSGSIPDSGYNLRIGDMEQWAGHEFNGTIDDVRIYNYALTPQEIHAIANPHRADLNDDGCIEEHELIPFIDLWKYDSTANPMWEVMEAVTLWSSGTGCVS